MNSGDKLAMLEPTAILAKLPGLGKPMDKGRGEVHT